MKLAIPMQKNKNNQSSAKNVNPTNSPTVNILGSTLKYGSLILGCMIVMLPLLFIFFGSFKDDQEFYTTPVFAPPINFLNFHNFSDAFTGGLMVQGFGNTAIIL